MKIVVFLDRIHFSKFEIDNVIPTLSSSILYAVETEACGLSHDDSWGSVPLRGGTLITKETGFFFKILVL